jgi:hypothetical protein
MKNTCLIFILICGCAWSFGQTSNQIAQKDHRIHEFRLSIGDPVFHLHQVKDAYINELSLHNIFQKPDGIEDVVTTSPITFGYRYRALKWLWIGGDLSFFYFGGNATDLNGNKHHTNAFSISLFFTTRLSYYNRDAVTLYSELSCPLISVSPGMKAILTHVTLFGFNAGSEHWFGSAEVGFGYKGIINLGVGYRF